MIDDVILATKNNISILGCGWLGFPLAKTLAASGFHIKGSTTTENKLAELASAHIEPFRIVLGEDEISGKIEEFLSSSATLILDIPPKSEGSMFSYALKIKTLIPYIENSGIKHVLFVSSTSVYGSQNGIVTEDVDPEPLTNNGKQLVDAENLLKDSTHFETTVLRFGGLLANDRHPIHSLAGKQDLPNPDAPINLIHRDDCLSIILKIIENKIWGETFNAVAPFHPSRIDYYTQKANALGLAVPGFSRKKPSEGKQVSPGKLLRFIKYNFLHPEL